MLLDIKEYIKNIPITGVLHIGAHEAEEEPFYNSLGLQDKDIVWVEAIPYLANKLKERQSRIVHNILILDKDDQVTTFHITNNMQSSSALELYLHKDEHPWVVKKEQIELVSARGDTVLLDDVIRRNLNMINLDIQGAELHALRGMDQILRLMHVVYVEVNTKELYKNCGLLTDIDELLAKYNYTREAICMTNHGWGDALYIKKPILYMKLGGWPRLANQMFQYAYGLSRSIETGHRLCIEKEYPYQLERAFGIKANYCAQSFKNITVVEETSFNYQKIEYDPLKNYEIRGYFQHPEYFSSFRNIIERKFQLPVQDARDILASYLDKKHEFICIHVRLPDTRDETGFIYTTPTADFLIRALTYLKATFDSLVIIISNNIQWSKDLYIKELALFYPIFLENSDLIDMALLTIAEKVIITSSSFGWWGAYLNSKAQVIAIEPWFNPNGQLAAYDTSGLYLPNWIKMANWI